MRVTTLLAGSVLAVALAGSAAAKGPFESRLCGSSGCVTLRGYAAAAPFMSWWSRPFAQRPAPRPAPFFRIVLRQDAPDGQVPITWTLLYVPKRDAMRIAQNRVPPYAAGVGPYWRTVPGTAVAALERATEGITPYPASPVWRGQRQTSRGPVGP